MTTTNATALVRRLERLRALQAAGRGAGLGLHPGATQTSDPDAVVRDELQRAGRSLGITDRLEHAWFDDRTAPHIDGIPHVLGFMSCPNHRLVHLNRELEHGSMSQLRWTVQHEAKHCALHLSSKAWCGSWTQAQEDVCDSHADSQCPEWGAIRPRRMEVL